MKRKNYSRKHRPITNEEVEAMLAFYGGERPRTMYDETFPTAVKKPKITITQTVIEFC